eukprot:Selendium_serpulae@DN1408_c0_g1_i1.p1
MCFKNIRTRANQKQKNNHQKTVSLQKFMLQKFMLQKIMLQKIMINTKTQPQTFLSNLMIMHCSSESLSATRMTPRYGTSPFATLESICESICVSEFYQFTEFGSTLWSTLRLDTDERPRIMAKFHQLEFALLVVIFVCGLD